MASTKICPYDKGQHVKVSGTKLREVFSEDENVSENFNFPPKVLQILRDYYSTIIKEIG